MATALDILKEGIATAKAGDKNKARNLFRQSLALDPRSEIALLWLAGLTESPGDTLSYLEQVLQINPRNDRALAGIKQARLQAGIAAVKAGQKDEARRLLSQSTKDEPNNELPWLWLASVTDQPTEAMHYLERVLQINPANERAKSGLEFYKSRLAPAKPIWQCPLCQSSSTTKQHTCPACGTILTLVNVNTILNHTVKDPEAIRSGIARLMGRVRQKADFTVHCYLGLAFLNLKEIPEAITHFQAALRFQPHLALQQQLELLQERKAAQEAVVRKSDLEEPAGKKRILVVDDSATIRKLVSMTMVRNGYFVIEAGDGNEAIERIREEGIPDLVLLDVMMPGMDGYTLCKQLRANQKTAQLPIIMLSGKDGVFNRMRGKMAGSTVYLTKPFQPDALLKVVQKYCPQPQPLAVGV